jgi:DNA-binding HxlR family transcriptional regulator
MDVPSQEEALSSHPGNHSACGRVAPVLQRIGDKWSILIVMMLGDGPRRFRSAAFRSVC